MLKVKNPMGIFIAIVFIIASVGSAYLRDWKMFWFYILSAAINIVVVL